MSVVRNSPEYRHHVAPDIGAGGRPAAADPVDPLGPAQDRLLFLKARSALASLCGCAESHAAQALLTTAARHGVATRDVGEQFLASLDPDPAGRPRADGEVGPMVISLLEAALSPSTSTQPRRGSRPEGRPDLSRRGADPAVAPAARPEPVRLTDLLRFRAWGLIVEGELDLTTGPALRDAVEGLDWPDPAHGQAGDALLLDLTAVTFIDARGTHALNDVHSFVTARGVGLHVTAPADPSPRRLLQYAVRTGWLPAPFAPGDTTRPPIDVDLPAAVRRPRKTYLRGPR